MPKPKNVLGEPLKCCCKKPLTGFYRDGFCKTGANDVGRHTVCALMTEEFLSFSKAAGNDLSTPRQEFGFPGLKPGDKWCLCVLRWKEALDAGVAPDVLLEATNVASLQYVKLADLERYAVDAGAAD
ncbi:MAG: DUF2237 domain-containing protein [Acidobacteriota bacterium]|nr:DUF2237 domain-containing protein [Acidobacteriota bacterium]MDH3530285.1 DUF2237 domain-containing protein [Acidobacteriota bacterium]